MADFPLRENYTDKLKQLKLQQQQRIPYLYKKVCEAAWFANMKMKYLEDEKSMRNILFFFALESLPILMNSIPNSSHIENVQSIGNEYGSAAVRAPLMLFRIRAHSKEKVSELAFVYYDRRQSIL